jgi:hypothetical protein
MIFTLHLTEFSKYSLVFQSKVKDINDIYTS